MIGIGQATIRDSAPFIREFLIVPGPYVAFDIKACQVDCYIAKMRYGFGDKTFAHSGNDSAGVECRLYLWLQHHGDDRVAERNGIPGHAPPGAGRTDSFAMGAAGNCGRGAAPTAEILQIDGSGTSDAGSFTEALSAARSPDPDRGGEDRMTRFLEASFCAFHLGLLRGASVLIPAAQRADWRREWQSELWHARRECSPATWQAQRTLTAFCLGAFQDAVCLRRDAELTEKRSVEAEFEEAGNASAATEVAGVGPNGAARGRVGPRKFALTKLPSFKIASFKGSAAQCLAALAAVLATTWIASVLLPGVDVESHPSRYQVRPGLILIQSAHVSDESVASITAHKFETWKSRRQRYFDGLAFYRMAWEMTENGTQGKKRLTVAHPTGYLLSLLHLPVQLAEAPEADRDFPGLILSKEAWRHEFGANPHIVGRVLRVGNHEALVMGVAPAGAWRLPGKPDAWLLEPDAAMAGVGYVVAHLTALGRAEMLGDRVQITSSNADDSDDELWGVSFEDRTQGPWGIYLFTVGLALLALPAITSVSMGEYSFNAHRLPWRKS